MNTIVSDANVKRLQMSTREETPQPISTPPSRQVMPDDEVGYGHLSDKKHNCWSGCPDDARKKRN